MCSISSTRISLSGLLLCQRDNGLSPFPTAAAAADATGNPVSQPQSLELQAGIIGVREDQKPADPANPAQPSKGRHTLGVSGGKSSTIRSGQDSVHPLQRFPPAGAVVICHPYFSPLTSNRSEADLSLLTKRICAGFMNIEANWGDFLTAELFKPLPDQSSNRFNIVAFNPHRQRALNRIDGDDQSAVRLVRKQNAFHSVQEPHDPHSLSDLQERMFDPGHILCNDGSQGFDLFVGIGTASPPHADNTKYSIGTIHAHALIVVGCYHSTKT